MNELLKIRLRTLGWLMFPVIVLMLIPWGLMRLTHAAPVGAWGLWQWGGVGLILNGLLLGAWCVNLFNVEGRGTPLPPDPPKRFVVSGPYRYVRNPMMLGVFLILAGEALMFQSVALLGYLVAIMMLAFAFVRFWEEPDLVRRFGQGYREYQQQVPRWIPRPPQTRTRD